MNAPLQTPVTQALDALGLPYRVVQHERPPKSVAEAAAWRGQQVGQVVRSLLFRLDDETFVLVLVPGGHRAHWPTLRRYLGRRRIAMATPAEVRQVTGYPIGAVSPLGLPRPLRILADARVFAPDEISMGVGVRGAAVILSPATLRAALPQLEVGDFAVPDGQETG